MKLRLALQPSVSSANSAAILLFADTNVGKVWMFLGYLGCWTSSLFFFSFFVTMNKEWSWSTQITLSKEKGDCLRQIWAAACSTLSQCKTTKMFIRRSNCVVWTRRELSPSSRSLAAWQFGAVGCVGASTMSRKLLDSSRPSCWSCSLLRAFTF